MTVSAIGDAKSLLGGTLVMTPLNGADGQIYAVAQGTIIAGGVSATGEAASVTQGVPTAGVIPSGARVEREVEFDFAGLPVLRLALKGGRFHHRRADRAGGERRIRRAGGRDAGCGHVAVDIGATGMSRLHMCWPGSRASSWNGDTGAGGGGPAVGDHRDGG